MSQTAIADPVNAQPKHVGVSESIARGALSLLSTQPFTWGASLLAATFVPRLLGAEALGQVAFAATLATLAASAAGLGVSEFLVRRVAQRPLTIRQDAGIALCVQLISTLLWALVIALVGPLFTSSVVDSRLLLVSLLPMLGAPAQTVLLSTFRGSERHKQYAWFNASVSVVGVVGLVGVLLLGGSALLAVATSGVVGLCTVLIGWTLSSMRPVMPTLDRSTVRQFDEFIRGGLPFLSWQITQMAYTSIDRLLLGALVATSEVGWYAAAARIIAIPIFIPTLIMTPLFPALSRSVHQPDVLRRSIAQALKVVLLLIVPLSAGTIVIAPRIPSLFGWPSDFENSVPLMQIMALQMPLVSVGMVLGAATMAIGRERRFFVVATVATTFNVAANLVMIPFADRVLGDGAIGASIIMVASEIVMLTGTLMLIPRTLLDRHTVSDAARICAAGAATVLVGVFLEPIALALCVAGGAVAYVATVVLLRAITVEEFGYIKRRVLSRAR